MSRFTIENWQSMNKRMIVNDEGQRIKHRIEEKIKRFKKRIEKRKNEYKLFDLLCKNEIIIGLLLSDAHLRSIKDGQNSCFVLDVQERHKEIIEYMADFFADLGIGSCIDRQLHNKKYWSIRITTYRNYAFTLLRKIWYPKDKKTVPTLIKLTHKMTAYWFMGDGTSYWKKDTIKKSYVTFYTDGFCKDDVLVLQNSLKNDICISGTHVREMRQPKKGYRIELSQSLEVKKLMELIEPYILKCFIYKIKIPYEQTRGQAISFRREQCNIIRNKTGQIIRWESKNGIV